MKIKAFIQNLMLVLISIVFILVFFEYVVFRFILVATDIPQNDYKNGIVKYVANQEGTFREKNEVKTLFRINANGWNSRYSRYIKERTSKRRIAVIGDSYVEALMVDYNNSIAEQLERNLGKEKNEVYRFAISGAPFSQYLHILREEVLAYKPEYVVFVLVHNDFDESWEYKPGRYTSSFLKLKIDDNMVKSEVQPTIFKIRWYEFIRHSATYRYLVYRQKVNVEELKSKVFASEQNQKKYEANIDVSNINQKMTNNYIATEYIIKEINALGKKYSFTPILIIDAERNSIYNKEEKKPDVLQLNAMVMKLAVKYQVLSIDLQEVFQKDFNENKMKFEYQCDSHWNAHGHKVASQELAKLF